MCQAPPRGRRLLARKEFSDPIDTKRFVERKCKEWDLEALAGTYLIYNIYICI